MQGFHGRLIALIGYFGLCCGVSLAPPHSALAAEPDRSGPASEPGIDTTASSAAERGRALQHGPEGAEAAARVLADFYQRGDGEGGFAWWMRLPISVRSRHAVVTRVRHWRYRVEFLRDAGRGDAAACKFSGGAVLRETDLGCDRADQAERYLDCTAADGKPPPAIPGLSFAELRAQLQRDAEHCPQHAAQVNRLAARLSAVDVSASTP